jgi:hypothetical protein
MRKLLIVSACAIAMSAGSAFAQKQPAPGASGQGEVGPGTTKHHMTNTHKGMTTGSSATRKHKMAYHSNGKSSKAKAGSGTENK